MPVLLELLQVLLTLVVRSFGRRKLTTTGSSAPVLMPFSCSLDCSDPPVDASDAIVSLSTMV